MKDWLRFEGLHGRVEVSPEANLRAIVPAEHGTDIHLEGSVVAVRNPPEEVEAAFKSLWKARADEVNRLFKMKMELARGTTSRRKPSPAGPSGGPYR